MKINNIGELIKELKEYPPTFRISGLCQIYEDSSIVIYNEKGIVVKIIKLQ